MITALHVSTLRKRLLAQCIEKQQSLLSDLQTRISSFRQNEGLGNEEAYDNNELALQEAQNDELRSLQESYDFAKEELMTLELLKPTTDISRTAVEPGAIVFTNRGIFFVSVSTEQFECDGKEYTGVSIKSPIYRVMKGLQKNDKFTCRGIMYEINYIV